MTCKDTCCFDCEHRNNGVCEIEFFDCPFVKRCNGELERKSCDNFKKRVAEVKRNKVYICGPMTGLPDHNYPAFHEAAKTLRERGYDVVSPAELDHTENETWEQHMKTDIKAMMDCNAISVLPGSDNSKGAMLERLVASKLGFEVVEF